MNKYFSENWIQREVLKFTDDQMAQIKDDFSEVQSGGMFGGDEETDEMDPFALPGDEKDDPNLPFDDEADDILSKTGDSDKGGDDLETDEKEANSKKTKEKPKSKFPPKKEKSEKE